MTRVMRHKNELKRMAEIIEFETDFACVSGSPQAASHLLR